MRGLRRERVVNVVADVEGLVRSAAVEDFYQAVGSRFGIGDILDCDDCLEVAADLVAIERVIQFAPIASGENGELGSFRETRETGIAQEPFFLANIALTILTPVNFLVLLFYLVEGDIAAELVDPGSGKFPIVVEAGAIFPDVQLAEGDAFFGEEFYGLKRGQLEGAAHIYQNAIYVENYDGGIGLRSFEARGSGGFAAAGGIRNGSRSILRPSREYRRSRMRRQSRECRRM